MRSNILQLIGSFHQGGSERQAVQLTRLLMESGRYNVFVATLEHDGVLLDDIYRTGIHEVPEYRLNSFYDLNAVRQLRLFTRYLIEHKIDLVHSHDFYTNIFGMAAAACARVPVRIASRRESGLRPARQRFVERWAYRSAHAVVANCENVHQQLINEGVPASKVRTLYNGLDPARVELPHGFSRGEMLAALDLPESARFVTLVANMRAHIRHPTPVCLKDHPTFLRAAQRVYQSIPDAAFIIAGEGELKDSTQELANTLGIGDRTFFIGRCQNVAALLSISEVCVLSSRAEGFSNSIIEYMASGRPVVATEVGGASEAVVHGKTGYLVPAGDHEQMAQYTISLLMDRERARLMGELGRLVVSDRFSSIRQLQNTEGLYSELLPLGVGRWASGLSQLDAR